MGLRHPRELGAHLVDVSVVDVAVAPGPHHLPDLQIGLLSEHVGQQRVGGDVEGHSEEEVGAALVDLQAQAVVGHIALEEGVAGGQRHVAEVAHVPG